ncbi:MAG: conjugal transfer protein TraF [Elusimicrobiota bacterium]
MKISKTKIQKFLAALLLLILMLPVVSEAAFEQISVGARPAGLGGAYTALSDDVYSVYYNPAGLALIPRTELTTQYSQLYMGLWDNSALAYSFVGIAQPIKFAKDFGTVGLSWLQFNSSNLYKENTMALSYGKNFRIGGKPLLDLGINLKSLSLGYGEHEYTYDALTDDGVTWSSSQGGGTKRADSLFEKYGFDKSAFTIDFGARYSIFRNYRLGLMVSNITEPNIALDPSVDAKLSRAINLGIAHTGPNYNLGFDFMTKQFNKLTDSRIAVAGEQYFPFGLGIRASLVTGTRNLFNFSCGFGYRTDVLQLDYAIEYPLTGIKSTLGSHRVSLIVRFGPVMRFEAPGTELQEKLSETERKLKSANVEIEKLRKDLDELLKKPSAVIPKPPEKPSAPAVAAPAKPEADDVRSQYNKDYSDYRKQAEKMKFADRIGKIKSIVDAYHGKTDVSEAEREYKILLEEQGTQTKMYKDSMIYYRKMTLGGIDNKTKVDLLRRIITKYEPYDIELKEAKEELEKLK